MELQRADHLAPFVPVMRPGPAFATSKRAVDIAASITALVMLLPVLLLVATIVVIDAGWPPLFLQRRVGLGGKEFTCLKFRTMVRNAHDLRAALEHRNEAPFPAFKINNDPRMTRSGSLLRRSSIDELPQFWNVLVGEMSVVGPRPPLPSEVAHYDDRALRRLTVRPGLTCTWQIEHRHTAGLTFEDWLRRDLDYIDNWSIARDLGLMFRTLGAVARLTGS